MAYLRLNRVEATNSFRIWFFSVLLAFRYLGRMAFSNSLLHCFVIETFPGLF
jgi:hypothetical protein